MACGGGGGQTGGSEGYEKWSVCYSLTFDDTIATTSLTLALNPPPNLDYHVMCSHTYCQFAQDPGRLKPMRGCKILHTSLSEPQILNPDRESCVPYPMSVE